MMFNVIIKNDSFDTLFHISFLMALNIILLLYLKQRMVINYCEYV